MSSSLIVAIVAFLILYCTNKLSNIVLFQQISLENDYLGPRRIDALKKEDSDWQKKAQEAVLNIQEFTVKYFEITARAQKGTV